MSNSEEDRKVRAYAMEHTQELIDDMIKDGLVEDTGQKRNGQTVYRLTEKCIKHCGL